MTFLETLELHAGPVRDTVRAALENGTPFRITAGRTWLDAGRTVSAGEELSVAAAGVVEYVPGDFTITVRAGTSLAEIARVTAGNGQWLPLQPPGSPDGSIGATVSTASAGPLAHAFGTPRDQVIGLGFVTGKGDYVRSGGRVVKNVAGFDLTRLVTGSWGTLGVITDVTLRLRVLPEADSTIALVVSDDNARFRRALGELSETPLAPYAMELLNHHVAHTLGLGNDTLLLARFGGNSAAVASQRETVARFGEIRDLSPDVWDRLRGAEPAGSAAARFSGPLAGFASLWESIERELEGNPVLMQGTPGRGVIRCVLPRESATMLLGLGVGDNVHRVFERLSQEAWDAASPLPNAQLSRRVREAFDPAALLNPGILGQPA